MYARTQDVTTSPPLTREQREAIARESSRLTLVVALVGLGAIVALLLVRVILKNRRRQAERADQASAARAPKTRVSAWEEAGRRMAVPPVEGVGASESEGRERGAATTDRGPASSRREAPPERALSPGAGGGVGARPRPLALITGGARRVGRASALALARAGCDVLFTYRTSEGDASTLAGEMASLGATASYFRLDLDDLDAVDAFASERAETLERLDVLVHNAAAYDASPLGDLTPDAAMRQYRVNAAAPLLLTARLAPLLARSILTGGGAVIALADIHAMGRPRKDHAAYAMSKGALVEMVHSLARDLAPGVRVNAIAPGVVAWPVQGEEATPEEQARYLRRVPLGRAGTPEDAAGVVRWLALEAPYVTGEVIRVDGGRWLG